MLTYLTESERDILYERCPEIYAKLFEIFISKFIDFIYKANKVKKSIDKPHLN